MEHVNQAANRALSALANGSTSSPLPRMSEKWVAALFKKFQARWLQRWTSAIDGIEAHAVREWSEGLAGLNAEHIRRGLAETIGDDWPPSMGEFRKACLGKRGGGDRHYCKTTLGEVRAPIDAKRTLPGRNRTPTIVEAVERHLGTLKAALK